MILTVSGLPKHFNYHDAKAMIKQEAHITNFILDNLLVESNGKKKVTVGLADSSDAPLLLSRLNGFLLLDHRLSVSPVGGSQPLLQSPREEAGARGAGYPPARTSQATPFRYEPAPAQRQGVAKVREETQQLYSSGSEQRSVSAGYSGAPSSAPRGYVGSGHTPLPAQNRGHEAPLYGGTPLTDRGGQVSHYARQPEPLPNPAGYGGGGGYGDEARRRAATAAPPSTGGLLQTPTNRDFANKPDSRFAGKSPPRRYSPTRRAPAAAAHLPFAAPRAVPTFAAQAAPSGNYLGAYPTAGDVAYRPSPSKTPATLSSVPHWQQHALQPTPEPYIPAPAPYINRAPVADPPPRDSWAEAPETRDERAPRRRSPLLQRRSPTPPPGARGAGTDWPPARSSSPPRVDYSRSPPRDRRPVPPRDRRPVPPRDRRLTPSRDRRLTPSRDRRPSPPRERRVSPRGRRGSLSPPPPPRAPIPVWERPGRHDRSPSPRRASAPTPRHADDNWAPSAQRRIPPNALAPASDVRKGPQFGGPSARSDAPPKIPPLLKDPTPTVGSWRDSLLPNERISRFEHRSPPRSGRGPPVDSPRPFYDKPQNVGPSPVERFENSGPYYEPRESAPPDHNTRYPQPRDVNPHDSRPWSEVPRNFGPRNNGPRDFEPRNDGPRDFEPRNDGSRDFGQKNEGPRDFGPRNDGPRDFGQRNDGPRDFAPKNEGPRDFGPRNDGPRDFALKNEGPRDFGPRNDGPRDFTPKNEGPRDFGPRKDGPRDFGLRNDGPRDFGPKNEAPRDFGPRNDGSRAFGPRNDGLRDPKTKNEGPRDFRPRDGGFHDGRFRDGGFDDGGFRDGPPAPLPPRDRTSMSQERDERQQYDRRPADRGPRPNFMDSDFPEKEIEIRDAVVARFSHQITGRLRPDLLQSEKFLTDLGKLLMDRVDSIFGGRCGNKFGDITKGYRKMYPASTDTELLDELLRPAGKKRAAEGASGPPAKQRHMREVDIIHDKPVSAGTSGTASKKHLPDKSVYKEKKARKSEAPGEAVYELPPAQRRALDAELDIIMALIRESLPASPASSAERAVVDSLRGIGGEAIRRSLDLHTTKRILNVTADLAVRIVSVPKPPSKQVMTEFLDKFQATSLKKSERSRILVATLPNYHQYERICKLGSAMLNDIHITIKPVQLSGLMQPAKAKQGAPVRNGAGGASRAMPCAQSRLAVSGVQGSDGLHESIQMDDLEDY